MQVGIKFTISFIWFLGYLVPPQWERGRHREHPKGLCRKSPGEALRVMTSLPVKRPTRADIAQLPVAHEHTQGYPFRTPKGTPFWVTWTSGTSGSHGTCTTSLVRKKRWGKAGHAQNILRSLLVKASSGHIASGSTTINTNWAVPIYYSYP